MKLQKIKEMTTADDQLGLVVPVNLVGFCVGILDANGETPATASFAGSTTDFRDQVGGAGAFLGENVTKSLTDSPTSQLETGIHLHWALPDGLTRAANNQGKLDFPAAPNRWLITRFVISGQQPVQSKSWVVESDALFVAQPAGQISITLPVKPVSFKDSAETQNHCFAGRSLELGNWPSPDPGLSMKDLTGKELSAVSNGVISFASFYPDGRSSFGFCDSFDQPDDPPITGDTPIQLAYVVNGWYADPTNDPLKGGVGLEDIQKKYRWTFSGKDEMPSFSTYYGVVQGIEWNPNTVYIKLVNGNPPPVTASVTIGNSPAEVMAAHFRAENYHNLVFFEQILHTFQLGKIHDFSQPQADQLIKMAEQLSQNDFSRIDSGTIYSIVKAPSDNTSDPTMQPELIDLPLHLAESLNELNLAQQQCDFYQAHMDAFRSQLFADWYHIFKFNNDVKIQNQAFSAASNRNDNWSEFLLLLSKKYADNLEASLEKVKSQLDPTLILKSNPAPRYWQPNEPVIAIANSSLSGDLAFPRRYGGDGEYNENDYLSCRLTTQFLTSISVNGKLIPSSQFSSVILPTPNKLPFSPLFSALLQEVCLLNTQLISSITSISPTILETALQQFLEGKSQAYYQAVGSTPSPVMMTWWDGENPWLPLFMQWSVDMLPLQPTVNKQNNQLANYMPQFFNANYTITDPDDGGYIQYIPSGSPGTISIDPQTDPFTNNYYEGHTSLSPSTAAGFKRQLTEYLQSNSDSTFQTILDQLQDTNILIQPLSGFNNALLMRKQLLQLAVKTDPANIYSIFSSQIAPVVGNMNKLGLDLTGNFNPIRAAYLKLSLQLVDLFGQRREVVFDLNCAASMTTVIAGKTVPHIAYLPPRLSQPARLLFRWIAADSEGLSEMNSHPATSPICGWLLPNHVGNGSMFLYTQAGESLGTLYISGTGKDQTVEWQSAPGDDSTINQSVEQVLAYQNPVLRDFAISMKHGSADMFRSLLTSMDTISGSINGQMVSSKSNMSVLVGKPVALTQAYLRLEVKGSPAINQASQCYTEDEYIETDSGFTEVQFPVILGDLKRTNDGLVGYFKQQGNGYDLGTFYTEGANPGTGVVQPAQDNLTLTTTPKFDPSDPEPPLIESCVQKVLMLVDPRADVHATMGILPTATLELPSDQCADALSKLEMSFLVAPILKAVGGLSIPTLKVEGFQFSWMEEVKQNGNPQWEVIPNIQPIGGKGVSAYTPQQLTEGWLQLNPILLAFDLFDAQLNQPVVVGGGATNSLNLVITNKKTRDITFTLGQLAEEGNTLESNCIFYIHFGLLAAPEDVAKVQFSADPGWAFKMFESSFYGPYWACVWTGSTPITLKNGDKLTISVKNLIVTANTTSASVYFDYYNVTGLNNGVYQDTLSVQTQKSSFISSKERIFV